MLEAAGRKSSRQAVLLGNAGTKRWIYFGKGARQEGLNVVFLDWKEWELLRPLLLRYRAKGIFLKIDPPLWDSCRLDRLNQLEGHYQEQLMAIASLGEDFPLQFLNRPEGILGLLNKQDCKKRLIQAGIPVTDILEGAGDNGRIDSAQKLLELMDDRRVFQVFIKPVAGSGAAGIGAFRFQPKTGRMALYTCAMENPEDSGLVNTKKLRCFGESRYFPGSQTVRLLNRLLSLDCIVERWYPKEEAKGYSYDLRAVVQDGRMDFCLARLSKGPITNLHLNNHPLPASQLGLPSQVFQEIENICLEALRCYPSLRSAGIDLLLEKGSLRPRIIEMNGQGDLIYQDIFNENKIYRHQARMIRQFCDSAYLQR